MVAEAAEEAVAEAAAVAEAEAAAVGVAEAAVEVAVVAVAEAVAAVAAGRHVHSRRRCACRRGTTSATNLRRDRSSGRCFPLPSGLMT